MTGSTMNTAIPGTRRQFREMADGTIRVQIDVDPPYRDTFFKMFSQIDMPVALAPLKIGPADLVPPPAAPDKASRVAAPEKPAAEPLGPRCKLAVQWCKDAWFYGWLSHSHRETLNGTEGKAEDMCAEVIRRVCGVTSRRLLDTDHVAAQRFDEKFRIPYAAYLKEYGYAEA